MSVSVYESTASSWLTKLTLERAGLAVMGNKSVNQDKKVQISSYSLFVYTNPWKQEMHIWISMCAWLLSLQKSEFLGTAGVGGVGFI